MRISIRKKVFAVFSLLAGIAVIQGIVAYSVLDDFKSFRREEGVIEAFELQLDALKHQRMEANGYDLKKSNFIQVFAGFLNALNNIKTLKYNSSLFPVINKKTVNVEMHAGYYKDAYLELIEIQHGDEKFHEQLLQNYRGLILMLPDLQTGQVRQIESQLWDIFFLHERIYHHRDISAFPQLQKDEDVTKKLTADREFLKKLHHFVESMENNYFLWLRINDRVSFLTETEAHFFNFAESMMVAVSDSHYGYYNNMMRAVFSLVLLAILSTLLFWIIVTRYLNRFLRNQHYAIKSIQAAEYDYEIQDVANDEFGELTLFMKKMSTSLQVFVRQLTESKDKYQTLIDTTDTGYVILDGAGNVQEANDNYVRMSGFLSLDEIKGRNVTEWTAPHDLERNTEEVKKCLRQGYINDLAVDYIDHQGNITPIEINASVLEGKEDTVILSLCRDIKVRKEFETALASEKERLAVTLRSIGDGVITTDNNGQVVLVNRAAEDLTGWRQEEAIGRPVSEVFNIFCEKTGEPCENPAEKVLKTGDIVFLANHTDLISKNGTLRSIADSGAPIRDKESRIIGVVIVFRDITEKLQLEEEVFRAKKLESIGILAGGIAHDFNNILAAILGNINLALFDPELPAKTKKLLSEAEKASIRAKDLTQQLLTFSKGGEPVKEVSSLESVIKDSANFVLHGDKVACRYDIPEDLWLVDIDKGQISQVIQNLVLNASHAMPDGGTITVNCENLDAAGRDILPFTKEGRFVKISIQDSGIGMPTRVAEKIFDPYFSTKQAGSGLGLAITQSIITKHNGHISVESSPGVGSTFTIYLPASSATEEAKIQKLKSSVVEDKAASQAKILVMDDDEMVQTVAQEMLIELGHEVVIAADGEEALKLYQESMQSDKRFGLVIMDLTIPGGMGGEEAVQEILNIDPEAKVIVSSGYSNDPIMANFENYGFCSAIVKPYQLQELSKVISQLIG